MTQVPSLAPYLEGVQVSAFRLETRGRYALTYEADMFDDFVNGRPIPDPSGADWFRPWLDMVQASPALWHRVRIVDDPPTDYQRFAEWCAQWNREAGEIIRQLPVGAADNVALSGDWWMFDDTTVIRLLFDDRTDDIARYELVDASRVDAYRRLRDTAVQLASVYELKQAG